VPAQSARRRVSYYAPPPLSRHSLSKAADFFRPIPLVAVQVVTHMAGAATNSPMGTSSTDRENSPRQSAARSACSIALRFRAMRSISQSHHAMARSAAIVSASNRIRMSFAGLPPTIA